MERNLFPPSSQWWVAAECLISFYRANTASEVRTPYVDYTVNSLSFQCGFSIFAIIAIKVFNIHYKSNIIIRYGYHSLSECVRPICVTHNPPPLDNYDDEDEDDDDGNNDEHKCLLQSN